MKHTELGGATEEQARIVRVFVASPVDVQAEQALSSVRPVEAGADPLLGSALPPATP